MMLIRWDGMCFCELLLKPTDLKKLTKDSVCSNVPVSLGRKPFWILCSITLLELKKENNESRMQEVKILRGLLSSVIGLQLAGSDISPFL